MPSSDSTVNLLVTANVEEMVANLQSAADAAERIGTTVNAAADTASEGLDSTGIAAEGLGVKLDSLADSSAGLELVGAAAESAAATVDSASAAMSGSLGDVGVAAEELSTKVASLGEGSDAAAATVDGASADMSASLDAVGAQAEALKAKMATIGEGAEASAAEVDASSAASSEGIDKTGASAFAAGGTVSNFGKVAALAVVGVAAAAVDLGVKWEDATDSLAAGADISTAKAQAIGQAMLHTGDQFTVSGNKMLEAYTPVAAQLGSVQGKAYDAAQAVQFESAAAYAAEATHSSLDSTTTALATTMQAYGLQANAAAGASSTLYVAGQVTGTGFDTVSAAVDKIKTRLGDLAPTVQDTSALLDDLTEHGETGRQALSALSTSVTGLLAPSTALTKAQGDVNDILKELPASLDPLAESYAKGTISSKDWTTATEGLSTSQAELATQFSSAVNAVDTANTKIKESGITVETAKGQFAGFGPIISQLHDQIQGMGTVEALATLEQDGLGASAQKLLPIVEAGSPAFDSATKAVDNAGAAHDAAAKATDNLTAESEKLRSGVENLTTEVGTELVPVLEETEKVVADVVGWFGHNEDAALALAAAVGTVLAGAIAVFTVNTAVSMVQSAKQALASLGLLGGGSETAAGDIEGSSTSMSAAMNEAAASISAATARIQASMTEVGASSQAAASEVEASSTEMVTAGEGASAAMGEEGMAGAMGTAEGASVGLSGALGPAGLGLAIAGLALVGLPALKKAISDANGVTDQFATQAMNMAADTLPQLTLKMADLQKAHETLGKAMNANVIIGQQGKGMYQELGQQMDTVRNQQTQLTGNLDILSGHFGTTKQQVEEMAQELGINLTHALNPAQVTAMGQEMVQMGIQSDGVKNKITDLSSSAVAAMSSMSTSLASMSASGAWEELGADMDSGVAAGIESGSNLVGAAAAAMAQSAVNTAHHAISAGSPSLLAAELIGDPIPQGVALGIERSVGTATAASRSMMSAVMALGSTATAAAVTLPGAGLGAGGSASTATGAGDASSLTVQFNLDGITLYEKTWPELLSVLLQNKRALVSLGLS